jgi:transposase
MGLIKPDDGWRLPDELWQQMAPLLPARKAHPLGGHNLRVSDRAAMNAILFVLRSGAQWNALCLLKRRDHRSEFRFVVAARQPLLRRVPNSSARPLLRSISGS